MDIKEYFDGLKYNSGKELLTQILDKLNKNDENGKIINYMENFTYLENLYKDKEFDPKKKEELYFIIKKSIFNINYIEKKQRYELISIMYNEKENIVEDYKGFIENIFFVISHSIDNNKIREFWKNNFDKNNKILNLI